LVVYTTQDCRIYNYLSVAAVPGKIGRLRIYNRSLTNPSLR
jgi:hypothetical protein